MVSQDRLKSNVPHWLLPIFVITTALAFVVLSHIEILPHGIPIIVTQQNGLRILSRNNTRLPNKVNNIETVDQNATNEKHGMVLTATPTAPVAQANSKYPWKLRKGSKLRDMYDDELAFIDANSPPRHVANDSDRRFPSDMPFMHALATCTTFACLRDAHQQPRAGVRFNYPHFMIIGFQKAATSSLYALLLRHKNIAHPISKEPEFFSRNCSFRVERCTVEDTDVYIHKVLGFKEFVESNGTRAAFEASTHYVRGYYHFASGLYETFPWLKVIIMVREPISRAMSMLVHNMDMRGNQKSQTGCLKTRSMYTCLLQGSQISNDADFPRSMNYSTPLESWISNFPAGQLMVIQYEDLIKSTELSEKYLQRIKTFLGLDPTLPKDNSLPVRNMRKDHLGNDGWPMKKSEYLDLIERIRPDAEAVARLVELHGLGRSHTWLKNWQDVWKNNLNSCDADGNCTIFVS